MNQTEKDILARAMSLCSKSEKAASDLRLSMTRWGLSDIDSQEKILKYLKENKYIDEARFARAYMLDKYRFNRWGKIKIKTMLRTKGISDSIISEALDSIESDEYLYRLKEDLINKKKTIKATNQYDLKAKLFRFAQSRGYETEYIYKAIDEILT